MNEKMPKLSHFCGVCQDEINERLGYKVCSCELCLIRIHAKCMFPNASEMKLKVLYQFNTCVPFLKIAHTMYIHNLIKNLFDFALVITVL